LQCVHEHYITQENGKTDTVKDENPGKKKDFSSVKRFRNAKELML